MRRPRIANRCIGNGLRRGWSPERSRGVVTGTRVSQPGKSRTIAPRDSPGRLLLTTQARTGSCAARSKKLFSLRFGNPPFQAGFAIPSLEKACMCPCAAQSIRPISFRQHKPASASAVRPPQRNRWKILVIVVQRTHGWQCQLCASGMTPG